FYNFLKEGRPIITPVLRYDSYEINDGGDRVNAWTFGLNYFVRENLKLRLEYWKRNGAGSVGNSVSDDNRLTLQFDAFF
ncbi:MAG: hypothetical protein HOM55_01290, partial [Proteobacteria bacterium]|nr:hypothetical protein [Pseudomonadota bacterium]